MIRRLPIYFLIDVSESMVGEPIENVQIGIEYIIKELKSDPYALETAYLSMIVFAGRAKTLVPLTELVGFNTPKLPLGGGTSLGLGLDLLMKELNLNIQKTTAERKGDWKPIIFLFTDGLPTDDYRKPLSEWKKKWRSEANLVSIAFGNNTDLNILNDISENLIVFNNTTPDTYKTFFKWVTASIKTSSHSAADNKRGFDLVKTSDEVVRKIDLNKEIVKPGIILDSLTIFLAKCSRKQKYYLIKYTSENHNNKSILSKEKQAMYILDNAYKIDDSYFDLTDDKNINVKISTESLNDYPNCPYCGSQSALSICSCGKLLCTGEPGLYMCPWCKQEVDFQYGGHFSMNKNKG